MVKYQPQAQGSSQPQTAQPKQGLSIGMIVLIVVLCFSFSGAIRCTGDNYWCYYRGFGAWLEIVVGCGAATLALLAAGLVISVVGIMGIFISPLIGLGVVGGGLLALGMLFLMLVVLVVGKLTPAICKGIGWIFGKLTGKNKAV